MVEQQAELTQTFEFAKVFVRALPPAVTEATFREYFERHGAVVECKLMPKKRVGFVTFENEAVVHSLLQFSHEIEGKQVEVKRAQKQVTRYQPTFELAYMHCTLVYPNICVSSCFQDGKEGARGQSSI